MNAKAVAIERWGIPDWECADAYPHPTKTSKAVWRWEFLRRRPGYRDVWEYWSAGADIMVHGDDGVRFEGELSLTEPDNFGIRHGKTIVKRESKIPYVTTNESVCASLGVRLVYDPRCPMSEQEIENNYPFDPVCTMVNYSHEADAQQAVGLGRPGMLKQNLEQVRRKRRAERERGVRWIRFDISQPIEPQIATARGLLQAATGKKRIRRPRRDGWAMALRALDARECGATYADMAAVFWPEMWRSEATSLKASKTEQSARDVYVAGIELRDNFPV